jgi:hypothetical protein
VNGSASGRQQAAVEAQVAAGAPGAVARVEAPGVGLSWAVRPGIWPAETAVRSGRTTRSASRV